MGCDAEVSRLVNSCEKGQRAASSCPSEDTLSILIPTCPTRRWPQLQVQSLGVHSDLSSSEDRVWENHFSPLKLCALLCKFSIQPVQACCEISQSDFGENTCLCFFSGLKSALWELSFPVGQIAKIPAENFLPWGEVSESSALLLVPIWDPKNSVTHCQKPKQD